MNPEYTIVIPAFNEAEHLPATLAAAREAMAAGAACGEIVVVDNNSTDATAEVAQRDGARVVFEPHNQISRARNAGGRAARGRFLVFIDADTHIDAALLASALEALRAGQVVGGGAVVAFDRKVFWPARLTLWMWNTYSCLMGEAAGCFLFCTREAFDAVDGFSERVYASEELWFSKAIKRWARPAGQGFVILSKPPAVTSARKIDRPWRTAGSIFLILLFPPAIFFRRLCGFWYQRGPSGVLPNQSPVR